MRKPLIALTVAASVFALTAAGATGFSIQKGESDTAVLINADGNQGSVEYNIEEPACDDTFTVDYQLDGTSLDAITLNEATDACTPPNVMQAFMQLVPSGISLTDGLSTFTVYSGDMAINESDAVYMTISGMAAYGLPDGTYPRVSSEYSDGLGYGTAEYQLPTPYSGVTAIWTGGDLSDAHISLLLANYVANFSVEVSTADSEEWTELSGSADSALLTSQSVMVDYADGLDLSGYSKMRVNVSITYNDWSVG